MYGSHGTGSTGGVTCSHDVAGAMAGPTMSPQGEEFEAK